MTDDDGDDGDDVQKYKIVFGGKCGQTDLLSQLHKDIWNRAIEKAASIPYNDAIANEIRKLKL